MQRKWMGLLKSRKLWASVIGLLVAFGLLEGGEEARLTEAIIVIVTAASYVVGTGLEDAGRGRE